MASTLLPSPEEERCLLAVPVNVVDVVIGAVDESEQPPLLGRYRHRYLLPRAVQVRRVGKLDVRDDELALCR